MATAAKTVYSLWLCPPEEISNKLRKIISTLSKQHDTIVFEPHITLIPAIYEYPTAMVMNKVQQLCSQLSPFKIKLKQINYGKSYYQCVYILVELTSELITANSICRKLFNKYDDPQYMPHLSLLYCDTNKVQKDIHAKIELKQDDIYEFTVDCVELWLTPPQKNKISEWDMVKRFPFKSQTKSAQKNVNNTVNDVFDEKELFAKDWGKGIVSQNTSNTINNQTQVESNQYDNNDKSQKQNSVHNISTCDNNGSVIIDLIDAILLKL
eukprot:230436_1